MVIEFTELVLIVIVGAFLVVAVVAYASYRIESKKLRLVCRI